MREKFRILVSEQGSEPGFDLGSLLSLVMDKVPKDVKDEVQ